MVIDPSHPRNSNFIEAGGIFRVVQSVRQTKHLKYLCYKLKTISKYIAPQHLLNGYKKLSVNDNMNIIQAVCDFILFTKRLT